MTSPKKAVSPFGNSFFNEYFKLTMGIVTIGSSIDTVWTGNMACLTINDAHKKSKLTKPIISCNSSILYYLVLYNFIL